MLNRNNKITLTDAGETSAADVIEETLALHRITQTAFAKRIGVSQKHLSQIMHHKAFVSTKLALAIEQVTGIPAAMMLELDVRYRLNHTPRPTPTAQENPTEFLQRYDWASAV
ncbi:helix-turn-helix transcriptional regulator [Lacticaseibacillus kribbianus]|uniref:helix-turn-helix transcriptional regulator n=1 Tax=Lacticaseibacillus kribbianus TaxID=2926292 RepID=UPI001CD5CF32|nr:helix-turn-helix domain-containing protein [Lacticaseibacillus kribbianus]